MSDTVPGPDFHPLYQQVKELLLQRVLSGDWKPGEVLPSESKLAQEYHVSQGTVRKAIEEMAADHVVVRHQGKGTFVSARGSETPVHFFSMTDGNRGPLGKRTTTNINWVVEQASPKEQLDLKIMADSEVVRIQRIRAVDGKPFIAETIIHEYERFPEFVNHLSDDSIINTYLILEQVYGVLVARADEWLSAIPADADDAAALMVDVGSPLLRVDRISYGLDNMPVDVRIIRTNTQDCLYFNRLS